MAWFMDTYSMHVRQHTPGVVTGKPLEIGGSRGRVEATGRGVSICALDEMRDWASMPEARAIVVQGFGNVGSIAAQMFAERGCKIVGDLRRHRRVPQRSGHRCRRRDRVCAEHHSLEAIAAATR